MPRCGSCKQRHPRRGPRAHKPVIAADAVTAPKAKRYQSTYPRFGMRACMTAWAGNEVVTSSPVIGDQRIDDRRVCVERVRRLDDEQLFRRQCFQRGTAGLILQAIAQIPLHRLQPHLTVGGSPRPDRDAYAGDAQQRILKRQIAAALARGIGINAVRECLHQRQRFGVVGRDAALGGFAPARGANEDVITHHIVVRAGQLLNSPVTNGAREFHLPPAILRVGESLRKEQIVLG